MNIVTMRSAASVNRRARVRPMALGVRAWTGRSALTAATSTALPPIATTGTRTTRVSAMRLMAPGARFVGMEASRHPGPENLERRDRDRPPA